MVKGTQKYAILEHKIHGGREKYLTARLMAVTNAQFYV
jgi:hypothetical protein